MDQNDISLREQILAILFYQARPIRKIELAGIFAVSEELVAEGLLALQESLKGRGVVLVLSHDSAELVTNPDLHGLIEKLRKENISGDLGNAALECLTIILYRGPISRADIDFIRGVNSQYSIRRLLVRGLIQKMDGGEEKRRVLYVPTTKLLAHLGITDLNNLPEYEKVRHEFESMSQEDTIANQEQETKASDA